MYIIRQIVYRFVRTFNIGRSSVTMVNDLEILNGICMDTLLGLRCIKEGKLGYIFGSKRKVHIDLATTVTAI